MDNAEEDIGDQHECLSNGATVKLHGRVLDELSVRLPYSPNVCCRVEKFGNVLDRFCDLKKKWVIEMGFEGLLALVDWRLPRQLCYCMSKDLCYLLVPKHQLAVGHIQLMFARIHDWRDVKTSEEASTSQNLRFTVAVGFLPN